MRGRSFGQRALAWALVIWVAAAFLCAAAAEPTSLAEVVSDSYLVMDAGTGQLLIAKNQDKVKFPASITKIMTLALTLSHGSLEDTLTVSETAVALEYGASHIALQPGEVISVRDAAMATLLASANDAANCLAEYTSGSLEAFAQLMSDTAAALGCTNTHFTNPSGLPDPAHYTTAHDMAKITAWALTVPGFRELFATTYYTMQPTNRQAESRSWGTQNAMIVDSAFLYPGAWGGKLGWTTEANHTMVTVLTAQGRDLVLVTMDSVQKYQKYWDGAYLLDTCFAQLQPLQLTAEAPSAPMYSGDTFLGNVGFSAEGQTVWVPTGMTEQELTLTWQLPTRLEVGDTTPALLQVEIPQRADCLPEHALTLQAPQGSLAEVQTAWRSLQAATDGAGAWHTVHDGARSARFWRTVGLVCGAAAALVLLAFSVRWFNLARRNLRRYGTLVKPWRVAAAEEKRARLEERRRSHAAFSAGGKVARHTFSGARVPAQGRAPAQDRGGRAPTGQVFHAPGRATASSRLHKQGRAKSG